MSRKVQKNICIVLTLIFISTLISRPISIKADVNYVYHGTDCYEDHPYCVFINTIVIPSGYPSQNIDGYHANMDIYHSDEDANKAFKIVYGDHGDVSNNEQDEKKEWRYLGFNINGDVVSNEDFTNDRET